MLIPKALLFGFHLIPSHKSHGRVRRHLDDSSVDSMLISMDRKVSGTQGENKLAELFCL